MRKKLFCEKNNWVLLEDTKVVFILPNNVFLFFFLSKSWIKTLKKQVSKWYKYNSGLEEFFYFQIFSSLSYMFWRRDGGSPKYRLPWFLLLIWYYIMILHQCPSHKMLFEWNLKSFDLFKPYLTYLFFTHYW